VKFVAQRTAIASADDDDWRKALHVASFAFWSTSLDKAVRRGGVYWIPVVIGGIGHLVAWLG
jgi:hypothetical protein